nr:hypothetical protein [Natrononativus amylolyticus]
MLDSYVLRRSSVGFGSQLTIMRLREVHRLIEDRPACPFGFAYSRDPLVYVRKYLPVAFRDWHDVEGSNVDIGELFEGVF